MSHDRLPVGAVLPYAGPLANTEAPGTKAFPVNVEQVKANLAAAGWLSCDGALLAIGDYRHLHGVIGNAFGGDATHFRVPDLRGRFLRGVSGNPDPGQPARDPDAGKRVACADGGNAGNLVGSLQTDSLQGHEHDYQGVSKEALPPVLGPGEGPTYGIGQQATTGEVKQGDDGEPRVASETRPVNLYMNYIIRFR